jgi:formylglycine-generating enzyme required for sulfatase activity
MRIPCWIALGLLLAALCAAPALPGGQKKGSQFAVLVAVSKYAKTDQWRPLPYTIDEMKDFQGVLLSTGFAKENIEFLHDQQTDDKLRPTSANLLKKLKLMLEEIGDNDTLLVALNGHGVQYRGEPTGYFCPVNADLLDKKTLVPMDGKDGIYGLLEQCKAKRKLLIVNACRNDPTRDLSFAAEKVQLVDRDETEVPKGIAAIFSCKPGQKSYYYPEEKNIKRSMFYHHVIEAWRGKYAEGEKVTLDHVFDVVTRKTAADARNIFSEAQTPWPRRTYEGEWLLSMANPKPQPPSTGASNLPAKPKAGNVITNGIGMKLAYIPPGTFRMGTSQAEIDRLKMENPNLTIDDEGPAHDVEISRGFYLGMYTVTIGQFKQFVAEEGYRTEAEKDGEGGYGYNSADNKLEGRKPQYTWKNTGWPVTDEHPVVNVSWNDAKAFCAWLSRRDKATYNLPSEAQWEYACRAGTTTSYYFGDDPEGLAAVGNVADATAKEKFSDWKYSIKARDGYVFTAPVGQFKANGFGLYDMHGNVWQWCEDWYDEKYYGRSPRVDPVNAVQGSSRVFRGGSWGDHAVCCRSAFRGCDSPSIRVSNLGFRVARSSVQ